jgi:O-6-methylguanine DNA methyltransferase
MERACYTGIQTPIGVLWAVSTEEGLLRLDLPRPREEFLRNLAGFELMEKPERFEDLSILLKEYFDGHPVDFDLPLDLRGTEFQRAVWEALRRIPYGRVSTYGRIAEIVNRPKAVRAVGNAVAKNPIAIVIPCHRVVRSDGSIGGFYSGVEMKRLLLSIEGVLETEGETSERERLLKHLWP